MLKNISIMVYSKDEEAKIYDYLERKALWREPGICEGPDDYSSREKYDAQEWLDKNYPKSGKAKYWIHDYSSDEGGCFEEGEERKDVESLNLGNLKGSLKIENFPNLEELDCSNSWLTSLEIINCPKLTRINCRGNLLTSFDFTSLNPETLVELDLSNNNFSEQDLTCFSPFVNLKKLRIDNSYDDERFNLMGVYNRFSGSLEPLKHCNKLRSLDIWNTNVDSGLEYLPDSIKSISGQDRGGSVKFDSDPEGRWFTCGVIDNTQFIKKLLPVLEPYEEKSNYIYYSYDLQTWRKDNAILVEKARKLVELENLVDTAKSKIDDYLQAYLEVMLDSQEEIVKTNNSFAQKQLEEAKNKFSGKLSSEEIEELCQIKSKIIQLQISLEKQVQFKARVEQITSFASGIGNYIWGGKSK